ncbi:MAG: hypothetical protein M9953_05520 [Thermomicrobiales bacterium]|nr:hypothetical protein [Thermomicrobiales bacterium]
MTAGLIPDGVHSHQATVRLAIKVKGFDNIVIVSDMMAACGLDREHTKAAMGIAVTRRVPGNRAVDLPDGPYKASPPATQA